MSAVITKSAVKTMPSSPSTFAVTTSASTLDLSAFKDKYVTIEPVGGNIFVLAAIDSATADGLTVSATTGANKGLPVADGAAEDFYISKNRQFWRVIGSASLTLHVWDTSTQ